MHDKRCMASFRDRLDRFQWALAARLTPGLLNAQHRYIAALETAVFPGARWLDIGCGRGVLPTWMRDRERRQRELVDRAGFAVGIDMDLASLRDNDVIDGGLMGDVARLPFADACFDVVSANMVAEHLSDPEAALRELHRVLAPGGRVLIHTPNLSSPPTRAAALVPEWVKGPAIALLEGRDGADVFPTHYRFNRRFDIERCATASGLVGECVEAVESSPQSAMLGPLVVIELLLIRAARCAAFADRRANWIITLRKPLAASRGFPLMPARLAA